jgi:hypothetical protein
MAGAETEMSDNPMHRCNAAPRCRAKSKRTGQRCRSPAVNGYRVCRMHGARGGAPEGKRNGNFRHGGRTKDATDASRPSPARHRLMMFDCEAQGSRQATKPHSSIVDDTRATPRFFEKSREIDSLNSPILPMLAPCYFPARRWGLKRDQANASSCHRRIEDYSATITRAEAEFSSIFREASAGDYLPRSSKRSVTMLIASPSALPATEKFGDAAGSRLSSAGSRFLFRLIQRPIKPTTTNQTPATIIQCGYSISESTSFPLRRGFGLRQRLPRGLPCEPLSPETLPVL